ncbi:hypothetical protein [Marinobacter sp.]|uniref:hypothetical protein n=1 Tax=Marinobacter sp. TaxID=50741 RepID=UPI0034A5B46B
MMLRIALTVLTALVLAGCSDSSSRAPVLAVDFTTFVKGEIENTEDDREAVNINQLEFSFNDQDNEQAFDDLF